MIQTEKECIPDVICIWGGWGGYLASHVYPGARVIFVPFGATATSVAEEIFSLRGRGKNASPFVLLHFDLSVWKGIIDDLAHFNECVASQGGTVWNADIRDIRKSVIHETCSRIGMPSLKVDRNFFPDLKVIIKSNLNSLGTNERRLDDHQLERLGLAGLKESSVRKMREYWVMSLGDVPTHIWEESNGSSWLVVERFVDRSDGLFFRTYFAGNQCILCCSTSTQVVKRQDDTEQNRMNFLFERQMAYDNLLMQKVAAPFGKVFRQAVEFADAFKLDFGSVDQVIDDHDQSYVIDVNVAPFWGREHVYPKPFQLAFGDQQSETLNGVDQLPYFKRHLRRE